MAGTTRWPQALIGLAAALVVLTAALRLLLVPRALPVDTAAIQFSEYRWD